MPSYEPTPKRFSMLSVSHSSASRRSSIDISNTNVANDTPIIQPLAATIDLSSAIKQLQHVRDDSTEGEGGDGERGRSRKAGGDRWTRAVWGHDETIIRAPNAKRESSASTRERIAIWEQRSRSQSMGRSKSRGRDLGPGSRISVVPEMPELASALSLMQEREREREQEQEKRTAEHVEHATTTLHSLGTDYDIQQWQEEVPRQASTQSPFQEDAMVDPMINTPPEAHEPAPYHDRDLDTPGGNSIMSGDWGIHHDMESSGPPADEENDNTHLQHIHAMNNTPEINTKHHPDHTTNR
jgi:hypothetical protein